MFIVGCSTEFWCDDPECGFRIADGDENEMENEASKHAEDTGHLVLGQSTELFRSERMG